MKTYLNLRNLRSPVWSLIFVSLLIASMALGQTNQPSASVRVVDRIIPPGAGIPTRTYYYDIDFLGGGTSEFFKLWRNNGFTNDSVILVGDLNRIFIHPFKIKDARLNEIAKAIESTSEGQLSVDVVEKDASHGNIWTVKMADTAIYQIKTRSCALPALFSGSNLSAHITHITESVGSALRDNYDRAHIQPMRFFGTVLNLDAEKIVVVVGTEMYVEAITGALEAAEKVAEAEKVEKSKPK